MADRRTDALTTDEMMRLDNACDLIQRAFAVATQHRGRLTAPPPRHMTNGCTCVSNCERIGSHACHCLRFGPEIRSVASRDVLAMGREIDRLTAEVAKGKELAEAVRAIPWKGGDGLSPAAVRALAKAQSIAGSAALLGETTT